MGKIFVIENADYSANAVGKFDFDKQVFRRKRNGKLERNRLKTTQGVAYATNKININGESLVLKFSFAEIINDTTDAIFSLADYGNNNGIFVIAYLQSNTVSYIKIYELSNNVKPNVNVKWSQFNLGNLGTLDPTKYHDFSCKLNFNLSVTDVTFDGVATTLYDYSNVTVENRFTNQNATLAFGTTAWNDIIPVAHSISALSYFQLKTIPGNVLLHFDFLGDNQNEILMDKAQLIQLKNTGVEIIQDDIIVI